MFRPLNTSEKALLDFLLSGDFLGAAELRVQAQSVQTSGLSCDCGCSSFSLHSNRALGPAPMAERVPTEAHGTDSTGHRVGVLLHVDCGHLSEVEISAIDGDSCGGVPDAGSLAFSEWSEPDRQGGRHLLNP